MNYEDDFSYSAFDPIYSRGTSFGSYVGKRDTSLTSDDFVNGRFRSYRIFIETEFQPLMVILSGNNLRIITSYECSMNYMLEYSSNILKYVGYVLPDSTPFFGLEITSKDKSKDSDLEITNEVLDSLSLDLRRLLSVDYILHELGFLSFDNLNLEPVRSKHGQEEYYFCRSVSSLRLEETGLCFFYELALLLSQQPTLEFAYFIGEYRRIVTEIRESSGIKTVGFNTYHGPLPMSDQSQSEAFPSTTIQLTDRQYSGSTVGGRPSGVGSVCFTSGNQFRGYLNNGLLDYGCFFHNLKFQLISRWNENNRVGVAIEQYGDGIVYFGYTKGGKKNGLGVIMMPNGSIILGNWENNKVQGMILSFSHVATVFSGNVDHQNFHGYGEMFYRNRSYYEGNWDRGQYHGLGMLIDSDSYRRPVKRLWNHGVLDIPNVQSTRLVANLQPNSSNTKREDRNRLNC